MTATCAYCGEELRLDGPMGWLHLNGSMYGADGHAVVPVTSGVSLSLPPPWER